MDSCGVRLTWFDCNSWYLNAVSKIKMHKILENFTVI